MSNSNYTRLIASGQISVASGVASFASNNGFQTLSRSSAGVYVLGLYRCYDTCRLVVNVTPSGSSSISTAVALSGDDSAKTLTIQTFTPANGSAVDSSFFVNIDLLPESACATDCDPDEDE